MNGVIFYLERECFVDRKDAQAWGGRFIHAHLYSKHMSLDFQEQSELKRNLGASIHTLQRLPSSHIIFKFSHGLYRDLCLCKPLR